MIRPTPKPTPRPKSPGKPLSRGKGMERGGPIKRKTRLQAKRWGIAYKPPRRLSRPDHDQARLDWCFTQPCVVPSTVPNADACDGEIHPCHEGARKPGLALKSPDALTFAMCHHHHLAGWTDHGGVFKGWSKEKRREWANERGAEAWSKYHAHGGRRSA